MFIACWITKDTNTRSEYVILIAFYDNNCYASAPHCYVTRTLPVLWFCLGCVPICAIFVLCFFRPGKVCALCNLGERSQLGQGDLMRFSCPEGFTPHKSSDRSDAVEMMSPLSETYTGDTVDRESVGSGGDKSPRGSGVSGVTCRRQKVMAKSR
jgi:hypothetical protein